MPETPSGAGKPAPSARKPTRRLDARSLRALAHPLRLRILELLGLDGPATATGLAKRLGENTGTVSWHLRHLAEHRFIEEDTDRGTKRERWWKAVDEATMLRATDFADGDAETKGQLSLYVHEIVQSMYNQVVAFVAEDWNEEWRNASLINRYTDLRMTPDQLASMNAELVELVERHLPEPDAEPEPGALPVVAQWQAFPRAERTAE
ncbi:helix-turn-helix domain-containing protein [Streptomyces sp. PTM05]|uniref:Helix-turn-helix domain-containing protein n=1 Tax=Streptantibioticus parmotrematis TaxID=2873249 RepID=A0ABS7QN09_9ACTN|nr:helix-turn-helix domain-containing protein [Streptantibioticus parmotrematis]MBY8884572.1 helix-turn-helix domain-containing protein [Streptantibioticus parmotrematis]